MLLCRSAGSLSSTSWFKVDKSGESSTSTSTSRTPYESSDSDDNFIEERSVPAENDGEEKDSSSSSSDSSICGELVLVPNREAEDDVESSDAEANFDRRIGSIVETANRLADEKEEEERARTLEREKPAEKTVVSSSTLPTPTRPRVKNLELLPQDTTGAGTCE